MSKPLIGVLALQGAVDLHRPHLEAAAAEFKPVKTAKHFEEVDAFILPGGESTTMLKLMERFDLWEALTEQFAKKPVWGICAGCILMADKAYVNHNLESRNDEDDPDLEHKDTQDSFGLLPITVQRNGYGTQIESYYADIEGYNVSFIRAPIIRDITDKDVEILATNKDNPVWIKHNQYMATTFHPELTMDFSSPMHRAFVELISS